MHFSTSLAAFGLFAIANAIAPPSNSCDSVQSRMPLGPYKKCDAPGTLTSPAPIEEAAFPVESTEDCALDCVNNSRCRSFGVTSVGDGALTCQLFSQNLIRQGFKPSKGSKTHYYNHKCYACAEKRKESVTFNPGDINQGSSDSAIATVYSSDGEYAYELHFQPDANVVVYQRPADAAPGTQLTHVWASYATTTNVGLGDDYCTAGDTTKCLFVFQGDGNLVSYAYPPSGPQDVLFNARTDGNPQATLTFQAQHPYLEITGDNGSDIWDSGNTDT